MAFDKIHHILVAILMLALVAGLEFLIKTQWEELAIAFIFAVLVIVVSVIAKKATAHLLDADIEHEIWEESKFGLVPKYYLKKPIPLGIIIPAVLSIFTLGIFKFMFFLTYETRALKYRAAKRFGYYSYKEITDWHNGLIGASGIFAVLIISLVSYLIPASAMASGSLEGLAKLSAYYAFWNIIPISKSDGTQIFFGSRILWGALAIISAIFTFFALTII